MISASFGAGSESNQWPAGQELHGILPLAPRITRVRPQLVTCSLLPSTVTYHHQTHLDK